MALTWSRIVRGWEKMPKNPLKLWRYLHPWLRWRLAVYRRKGKGQLAKFRYDFQDNWHYRRYSRLSLQFLTVSIFILGTVFGSYATIAGVAKLVRALTETTLTMPTNLAFNAMGYDNASGSAYVLASEVRIATSSSWWNSSFQYKQPVTLRNLASATATTMSAQIALDTASLVNSGKLQNDCDDLRVVYESTLSAFRSEIPRSVQNCNDAASIITFPLQNYLSTLASDSHYEVYYGDNSAPSASYPKEKYLTFDGTNDKVYFPAGSTDFTTGANATFTVDFWVYATASSYGNFKGILGSLSS